MHFLNMHFDNCVLIFGSGRSGTSWLSETMSIPRGYRLLFEPEHPSHVPEGSLLADRLLLPNLKYAELDDFLHRLFYNRVDNDWVAQHSNRKYKMHLWNILVKKIIVKFVRCNLGMHYIAHRFPVNLIYLRRDPFSTIFSQQRVKFPWLYDLSIFQQQQELVRFIQQRYGINLANAHLTDLQKLSVRWAIENIVPFEYFDPPKPSQLICIDYELLSGDIECYKALIQTVKLKPTKDLEKHYERPSSKTHPKSNYKQQKQVSYEQMFSTAQIHEIQSILDAFKF